MSDILLHLERLSSWGKSLVRLSSPVEENLRNWIISVKQTDSILLYLLEVPPDVLLWEGSVVQHLGVIESRHGGVTPAQGPGVDRQPVLTVDVRPGEESEVWLEVVARSDVLDGIEDLCRVPRGLLLWRSRSLTRSEKLQLRVEMT